MNNQDYIEFRRKRDLGMMITDTIKFLSEEWKPFLGTVIKVAIVPIIIAICASVYFTISFTSFFETLIENITNGYRTNYESENIALPMLVSTIFNVMAYAVIVVSALSYIKSYIANKGVVNFEEVGVLTKKKSVSMMGLVFLRWLIIVVASMFCLLPGLYFGVVLSLCTCIFIFQERSVTESISDAFDFISGHWWETFGVILVFSIIIWFSGVILDLPLTVYQYMTDGIEVQIENPSAALDIFSDPIYLILMAISFFIRFILYIAIIVFTVFVYFDIEEQKYPSTPDVIDEIGSHIS